MRTRIKICCISTIEEAEIAVRYGADALGLVARMPSGPGPIADELIREISLTIPPPVARFLLSSEQLASDVVDHIRRTGMNTIQLVDELTDNNYQLIRQELPYVNIVQVIHVTSEENIEHAMKIQKQVDAILLDSGNPAASIKTLGGTGNIHNWEISREIVRSVKIPVFLAGGLNSNNVREAINKVQPYGVDVCSGVRTEGKLDPIKLEAFFKAVYES
jgi:phosphoribosylanthranilate isomerase